MSALTTAALAAPTDPIPSPEFGLMIILPVLIVLGAAVASVAIEALVPKAVRYDAQVALSVFTVIAAGVFVVLGATNGDYDITFAGAVVVDAGTYVIWGVLLLLALPSLLLMADRVSEPGGAFVASAAAKIGSAKDRAATATALPMQTEVFPLALFAIGGMMIFPASSDLLTWFIALEVFSLPLYLMCGLARRRRLLSQEAAVKYFLLGAFASALVLYGIAMLYGYAGTVSFAGIGAAAAAGGGSDTLLLSGVALLTVGLLFKASVGPFHLWTPDVYQGAPTPVTAFMASCTKVAAFAAMLRIFEVALSPLVTTWRPVLAVVAVISMMIGAIIGITQTDFKRMLAYSSVAHAGFLLMGVIALSQAGTSATMFYLLTYGFATIGALAIVTLVRKGNGEAGRLSDWAGLAKRSPMLAAAMTFFMLSFAGIPLTAGFIGKVALFTAAAEAGLGWLVVVAMIATVITAFFYMRVVVLMYFTPPSRGAEGGDPYVVVPGPLTTIVIVLGLLVTLILGLAPNWFLDLLSVPLPFLS